MNISKLIRMRVFPVMLGMLLILTGCFGNTVRWRVAKCYRDTERNISLGRFIRKEGALLLHWGRGWYEVEGSGEGYQFFRQTTEDEVSSWVEQLQRNGSVELSPSSIEMNVSRSTIVRKVEVYRIAGGRINIGFEAEVVESANRNKPCPASGRYALESVPGVFQKPFKMEDYLVE